MKNNEKGRFFFNVNTFTKTGHVLFNEKHDTLIVALSWLLRYCDIVSRCECEHEWYVCPVMAWGPVQDVVPWDTIGYKVGKIMDVWMEGGMDVDSNRPQWFTEARKVWLFSEFICSQVKNMSPCIARLLPGLTDLTVLMAYTSTCAEYQATQSLTTVSTYRWKSAWLCFNLRLVVQELHKITSRSCV